MPWCLPSCFYWAPKLPRGTFWAGLKTLKPSRQLSKASAPHNLRSSFRSIPLALPWCLPIGPKSCFYWASKLPRGTFWAGLKTLKSLAAAFKGLSTAQLSAAAPEASCWLCHGGSLLAPQVVSIGLRNCHVARFGQAFEPHNPPQLLSKRPWCLPIGPTSLLALPWCLPIGPKSYFYWASKLPRGTFWASLKTIKTLAAAFEGLSTSQPSAAALEASCWLCHGASLLAPQAVSIGLRNCHVARFGQAVAARELAPGQLVVVILVKIMDKHDKYGSM